MSPPWWKTPLAYGSYALIALGLLLAARRVIVREERLKADLRLEHLNFEKAKEVDRIKTSFFTNISHEFRTPLTLISGPVQELMEKYADDPRTQAKLKQIKRNSELLLRLINQLLDLARLEAGTLKLENSEGDIYTFVRSIARSFESFAQQKDISLFVEAPGIVHSITFDKNKVETIIINLVNNAIKFTPSGGSVRINALAEESKLRLSIKDTGIGIPKENQEKIFERFHQVSEAHKEVGTGVGLSLVRELVALMGGSIEVVSSEGEGSEFKVIIPIQNALADLTKSVEESQQFVSEPTSNGSEGKKYEDANVRNGAPTGSVSVPQILVIEDNVDVREFIIDCLGSEFSFIEAENGAVGLEKAKSETPDMIISDVMMPIMDGIRMTEKIKTDIRTSHIPLIMLTAKSTEDSKLLGLRTGADDYLTKPFNKNELLLKVRNAIVRQAKLREKLRVEVMSVAPQVEVLSQDERFLKNVREKILNRLSDEQLGVESLAEDVALSRSQLQRKLKALTGMSVSELIRKLRLQRAAQLIEQNWGPVTQVAYEVGIANLSYFAKIFKDEFGVLPSVYAGKVVRHS